MLLGLANAVIALLYAVPLYYLHMEGEVFLSILYALMALGIHPTIDKKDIT